MGNNLPPEAYTPAYVPVITFIGGTDGDDVSVATAAATNAYAPVNQAHKAETMVPPTTMAVDITTPRGWIDPHEPYGVAPTPVVSSINPTSHAVGPGDPFSLAVTGTGFLPGSIILFGNNPLGERTTYVSPTELRTIIQPNLFPNPDPAVKVSVSTGGVVSNQVDFAFTA